MRKLLVSLFALGLMGWLLSKVYTLVLLPKFMTNSHHFVLLPIVIVIEPT